MKVGDRVKLTTNICDGVGGRPYLGTIAFAGDEVVVKEIKGNEIDPGVLYVKSAGTIGGFLIFPGEYEN